MATAENRRGSIGCTFHSRGLRSRCIDRCYRKQIPIDKIAAGVEMLKPQLAATREAAATAAQAIMTTDTEPKEVAVQIEIGGKP